MNISSSSSSVDTSQLTAQLTNLQKQLTAEAKSKDDAKTKETKEAALQNEIAMAKQQKVQTSLSSSSSQSRVNETKSQE